MICSSGNVDSNRLRTGTMTEEDWNRFTIAVGKLSRTKIFIDDTPGIRITDLRSKCRRLKQEHGLDMIVIDYLQLIQVVVHVLLITDNKKYLKFHVL